MGTSAPAFTPAALHPSEPGLPYLWSCIPFHAHPHPVTHTHTPSLTSTTPSRPGTPSSQVQIVDISTTGQPGNLKEAKRFSQRYMVEVTTRVAEGRHIEGARALGSFAEKLAPLVALQRPPDGVQA